MAQAKPSTLTVRQPAPDGMRFEEHALDHVIGHRVPLEFDGRPSGECTVVAIEVIEDGAAANFTLEVPVDVIASRIVIGVE